VTVADIYPASPIKPKRTRATKDEMSTRRSRVIEIVENENPATVRQVYYQAEVYKLVGKEDSDYNKIQNMLTDLRRDGMIPYEWIVDEGRRVRAPYTVEGIVGALNDTRSQHRKDPWPSVEDYVQIWIEKNALLGVVEPVTREYAVPLLSAVGYSSISFLHKTAQTLKYLECPIYIYQFGDLDPSGAHAAEVIERELRGFAPEADIHFERIAITPAQITEFALESALRDTKTKDPRYQWFRDKYQNEAIISGGRFSVELDAIRPNLLRNLVRGVIERHLPRKVLDDTNAEGEREKAQLGRMMDEYIESTRPKYPSPFDLDAAKTALVERILRNDVLSRLYGEADVYPASPIKSIDPLDRIQTLIREASWEDVVRLRDWFMGSAT
jgi:hypothetical protein